MPFAGLRQNISAVRFAHDVLINILRTEEDICGINIVTYEEGPNWLDEPRNLATTADALGRAVRQDVNPRAIVRLDRSQVLNGELLRLQQHLSGHQLIGISSRVITVSQKVRHIPLMDFRCEISSRNEELLREVLPLTGQGSGYVLNSGRSYHFYGTRLLTVIGWRKFLGKCLLLRDLVDERYVGHQLVDGYCVLRISKSSVKPFVPRVILSF